MTRSNATRRAGWATPSRSPSTLRSMPAPALGLIGLVGTLFAGLGWVANLRLASSLVWGTGWVKRPFLKAKIADGIVLVGLGIALLVSLALTAGGTRLSSYVLTHTGLKSVPGSQFLTPVVGIVVAIAADHRDLRVPAHPPAARDGAARSRIAGRVAGGASASRS